MGSYRLAKRILKSLGADSNFRADQVKKLINKATQVKFIDELFYQNIDLSILDQGLSPTQHFWKVGFDQKLRPNLFFNPHFYLKANPDVANSGLNPVEHYLNYGFAEGRVCHEILDVQYYLRNKYPNSEPSLAQLMQDYYSGEFFENPIVPHNIEPIEFRIRRMLQDVLAKESLAKDLSFEAFSDIKVSIIIPVYGQLSYTLNCLKALAKFPPAVTFEIIIIDDCSPDNTSEVLSSVSGLRYYRNENNLGFLKSCNYAATLARGEYLVFLNNDTCPLPGWLDRLLQTFTVHQNVGLVGAKLVYPDCRLQEAGGLIWSDASGLNCGRLSSADHPDYNFTRAVDYCSGAAIMVPQKIWQEVGGFDLQFAPAYYEDTDLAFSIRQAGYQTLYQPQAEVIHFEGISCGTDPSSGVKSYQVINQGKFLAKWSKFLTQDFGYLKHSNLYPSFAKKKAIVIDHLTPTPDTDAGSVYSFNLIKLLNESYQLTFISGGDVNHQGQYTKDLQMLGVRAIYGSWFSQQKVKDLPIAWDQQELIVLQRYNIANKFIDHIKFMAPKTKTLLITHDLHHYRLNQEAELLNTPAAWQIADISKAEELSAMLKCTATVVLGSHEMEIVKSYLPQTACYQLPFWEECQPLKKAFAERKNIFFLGGFNHPPNGDALTYFLDEIWPLVSPRLVGVKFYVYGSKIPDRFNKYISDSVEIGGYVRDLDDIFNDFRISIAPLRYGAGQNGKVIASLCRQLPMVVSPIAATGIGLTNNLNTLIGEDAQSFADQLVSLYTDQNLWESIAKASGQFAKENLSTDRARSILKNIFADFGF